MTRVVGHSPAESVEIVIVIDEGTYALLEYGMDWKLGDESCDTYRIEARDAKLDINFTFPHAVQLGSDLIDDCNVESLGSLSGNVRRSGTWARECGPDRSMEGYARPYRFSLDGWSVVRFELSSADDTSFNLLKNDGSGDSSTVAPSASGYYFPRYSERGSQVSWAHTPLAPGSYTVEAVTKDLVSPGAFTLRIAAQPTPPPPYRFKSISAGEGRTCGLLSDGTPLCWGTSNVKGEGAEMPGGRFMSISTGRHTCALRGDGTPVCWDFKQEGKHTCAPEDDGSIFCLRNDQDAPTPESRDQDGGGSVLASVTIGVRDGYTVLTPPDGEKLTSISTDSASCGLREDGTPVCWGSNHVGQASPPAGERFVSIDAGSAHSCGLREDGTAVCWGADWNDRLSVPEAERFIAITTGTGYTCGLREDGAIVCWGDGTLVLCVSIPGGSECWVVGSGDDFLPSPPEDERFTSLSSGEPSCALRADGTPVCWPKYNYQSGLAAAPEGERFTSISSSSRHACALREDGTAVCWGEDAHGQSSPPSGVSLTGAQTAQAHVGLVSISAGGYHTCALDSDGDATCWGIPWWSGQFAGRLTSISSGSSHACGLRLDGTPVCRGNDRQDQSSPPPGEVFASIASGDSHSCGLRPDGTAVCWGSNHSGQSSPPAGEVLASISSGRSHVCGLRKDGTVVCLGRGIPMGKRRRRRERCLSLSLVATLTLVAFALMAPPCAGAVITTDSHRRLQTKSSRPSAAARSMSAASARTARQCAGVGAVVGKRRRRQTKDSCRSAAVTPTHVHFGQTAVRCVGVTTTSAKHRPDAESASVQKKPAGPARPG